MVVPAQFTRRKPREPAARPEPGMEAPSALPARQWLETQFAPSEAKP